jgi:hypothetical protein
VLPENAMEQASVNQIYRLDQSPSAQAERLRRKPAARWLGSGATSCSAERGKLKTHPVCRNGLHLLTSGR